MSQKLQLSEKGWYNHGKSNGDRKRFYESNNFTRAGDVILCVCTWRVKSMCQCVCLYIYPFLNCRPLFLFLNLSADLTICVCMYVCVYVCICVCIFIYLCIYVRIYVCMYVCIFSLAPHTNLLAQRLSSV